MTTLAQANTIELRLHVHSQMHEILMSQAGVEYDAASKKAYDAVAGKPHKKLTRLKKSVDDGGFDTVSSEYDFDLVLGEQA